MLKVRRKPVTLDAHQWFPYAPHAQVRPLPAGAAAEKPCHNCNVFMREHGYVASVHGTLRVCPGDWVLTTRGADPIVVWDSKLRAMYEEVLDVEVPPEDVLPNHVDQKD